MARKEIQKKENSFLYKVCFKSGYVRNLDTVFINEIKLLLD